MSKKIVIYHANCTDGFGAAFAAWLKLGDDAEYIPARYGNEPPEVSGKDVYIFDFSYKRDILVEMASAAKSLIVLDHHKSAQEDLEGLPFAHFNMDKSGAVLAWEYFHPGSYVPWLFQHIQDRDLWRFEFHNTRAISAGLEIEPMSFENWQRFLNPEELWLLEEKGRGILDYQQRLVKNIIEAKDLEMQIIAGHRVPCINTTMLMSEIGNQLSKDYPFSASWFETKDKRIYSLRSSESGLDVSEIARKYGGGGHYHAAGFTVAKPVVDLSICS